MDEYLERWIRVIDGMRNVNTYKLAWGRAIVELCYESSVSEQPLSLHFNQISELFLKYYWNQTFFFKLYQGPAKTKPEIQQKTEEIIERYQNLTGSTLPVWFDYAKKVLKRDESYYRKQIQSISKSMSRDVAWRFTNIDGESVGLYQLDLENQTVIIDPHQQHIIKEHAFVLSQLMNYRWAQLLEKFNQAPRIASKVKGFSEEKIRRGSLAKFKEELLKQFPDGVVRDFYTNQILETNDISIDHVIPWSFMFSDDIWNLVITSKRNNSSKSNSCTSRLYIERLKERNTQLVSLIDSPAKLVLEEAAKYGFVDRFYFNFATRVSGESFNGQSKL